MAPFSTQYFPDPRPFDLTTNLIDSSHITNGSISTIDIADSAITRAKLSEMTTNLIIYNSDTSTTTLSYTVKLTTAGTTTTYFSYPMAGIAIGGTHSLRVCIPGVSTQIKVQIDVDNKTVTASEVFSGAEQVGTYINDTLTFTLLSSGYDNVQIGFAIENSV